MIARGVVPQGCLVKSVLENEAGRLSTEEQTLYRFGECYLRSMACCTAWQNPERGPCPRCS